MQGQTAYECMLQAGSAHLDVADAQLIVHDWLQLYSSDL